MYKKEAGIFKFKYRNDMLPQSLDHGIFTNHQSNHNYDTRNKRLPVKYSKGNYYC